MKVIHQSHLDIGINLIRDTVDHSLEHSDVPDFGTVSVKLNFDFQLIGFAVLVDIMVQDEELWRQIRCILRRPSNEVIEVFGRSK